MWVYVLFVMYVPIKFSMQVQIFKVYYDVDMVS